jgi:hypothetical protein
MEPKPTPNVGLAIAIARPMLGTTRQKLEIPAPNGCIIFQTAPVRYYLPV